jgi:hypothetical protein
VEDEIVTKLQGWVRRNEGAWSTWDTKFGGRVYGVVLGGEAWRFAFTPCNAGCGALVADSYKVPLNQKRKANRSKSWKILCSSCASAREEARNKAHDAGARERMRVLRAKRNADRDVQFEALGIPLPRRGRPIGWSPSDQG